MKILWFLLNLFCITFVSMKSDWSIATQGQCQFTINNGFSIIFTVHPALFIHKEKTLDLASCRMMCCSHDTCNGYVWDIFDLSENCKLLKCSSEGQDCKNALTITNIMRSGQVGFVTGYNEISPAVKTTSTTPMKIKLPTIQKTNKPYFDEHVARDKGNLPINFKKAAVAVGAAPKISNWLLQKFNALDGNTTNESSATIDKRLKVNEERDAPTLSNKTVNKQTLTVLKRRRAGSHTDSVSLVMATFIGVGFLFAIMIMVGRRWIEGLRDLQKRDYSRLSYLLNGND